MSARRHSRWNSYCFRLIRRSNHRYNWLSCSLGHSWYFRRCALSSRSLTGQRNSRYSCRWIIKARCMIMLKIMSIYIFVPHIVRTSVCYLICMPMNGSPILQVDSVRNRTLMELTTPGIQLALVVPHWYQWTYTISPGVKEHSLEWWSCCFWRAWHWVMQALASGKSSLSLVCSLWFIKASAGDNPLVVWGVLQYANRNLDNFSLQRSWFHVFYPSFHNVNNMLS